MPDFVIYVAAFVVAIGLIVTIHEFGHFIVARWMGVKVLRFSVGFGKPLWMRISPETGTEYVVAAIPLGGYVKMLDEREGEVSDSELPFAFNRKPLSRRAAVVAAGPFFNFLFAIVAYAFMLLIGVDGMLPSIGAVSPNGLAERAGLRAGDVIVEINDTPVQTWEQAGVHLIDDAIENGMVRLRVRDVTNSQRDVVIDLSDTRALLDEGYLFDKIGVEPWSVAHLPPVIGEVVSGEPADKSGLQAGDEIVAVNNQIVGNWRQWVELIRANGDQVLPLQVRRAGELISLQIIPREKTEKGKTFGYIGAAPYVDDQLLAEQQVTVRYGLLGSIQMAAYKTVQMSWLTVQLLGKLLSGQASLKNVSGPISIAEYAGISASHGLAQYLSMLAIISISIGILNLLPIPMLDGGHLLYYFVEAMTGREVSETIMEYGQRVGIFILVSLMGLAFYNDLTRIFG